MTENKKNLGIKSWAAEDRPREKLLLKGKNSLSTAELLAVLIGSGNTDESAVGLCKRILRSVDNNLNELAKFTVNDLKKFKGIGEAKAISIVSALEIGKRRQMDNVEQKTQITSAADVYEYVAPLLLDLPHEEFWLLLLNRSNRVVGKERISTGGVAGTVVDVKIIFKHALEYLASSVIVCHNHPSGNLSPSKADIQLTHKIKEAGELLEVQVLDHLIITEEGFYSFADEGQL